MRIRKLISIAGLSLLVIGTAACSSSSADEGGAGTVTFGEIAELTGAAEAVGGPQHNGIKLAVDQINQNGGLKIGNKKYKIDLKTEDTKSDPTVGVQVVQKLLTQEGAHFLVGSLSGAVAAAYLPIIKDRADVIDVVVGAANPGMTDNASVYRPRADAYQNLDAEVAVALSTAKQAGATAVGVVYDSALQSNTVGVPRIVKAIQAASLGVTGPIEFKAGATQFSSQIAMLSRSNAKLVIFQGYATDMLTFVKQAREQRLDATVVAASGATAAQVKNADVSTAALENVIDIGTAFPADVIKLGLPGADAAKSFQDAYQAAFKTAPGYTSASAYGGVYILAKALEKAGSTTDIAAIRKAMDTLLVTDVPQIAEPMIPQSGGLIFKDRQAYFHFIEREWDGTTWATVRGVS